MGAGVFIVPDKACHYYAVIFELLNFVGISVGEA